MFGYGFYVDPSRCIGCRSCEAACAECDTHRGIPMVTVDFLDRSFGPETAPTICMHCADPTCAQVCPADAIKKDEDGIVHSALTPRCIACGNCVQACPFGVPKLLPAQQLMVKCDMCYDRTSVGKRPMCATVCPSGALSYVRPVDMAGRREKPVQRFRFGNQVVETTVAMMAPAHRREIAVDAADYVWEPR